MIRHGLDRPVVAVLIAVSLLGVAVTGTATGASSQSTDDHSVAGPVDVSPADLEGSGTAADPYVITNASELQAMADAPDANYTLGGDINATETRRWNGGAGFAPIGDLENRTRFTGSFDGAGHNITGLTIDRPRGNASLFENLGDATVQNVTLLDLSVTGASDVGGLVGKNFGGTINRVGVHGSVRGTGADVGGLVGDNQIGTIERSYANVTVSGGIVNLGGLAGSNLDTINQTYARGAVTGAGGASEIGGLVGFNFGRVNRSYATGAVTGGNRTGGLVGANVGPLRETYWDRLATNQSNATGTDLTVEADATGFDTDDGTGRAGGMTGDDARENMSALAFGNVWQVSTGYPVFVRQPVEAAGPIDSVGSVAVDVEFAGIVRDEGTMTVTATEFEDAAGNTIDNESAVTVEIAGEPVGTAPVADGTLELEIDPATLDETAIEPQANATISIAEAESEGSDTATVRLVHEVLGLEAGTNTRSIPQPARLHAEGVNALNQWDTENETYVTFAPDEGQLVDDAVDLHRGLYVDAASDDARLGYEFVTEGPPQPGQVSLSNGWHLASSNFAIDSEVEGDDRSLDADLFNIQPVDEPGIGALDSRQKVRLGNRSQVGAYEAYWLFVDEPERNDRAILAPAYDPTARANVTRTGAS